MWGVRMVRARIGRPKAHTCSTGSFDAVAIAAKGTARSAAGPRCWKSVSVKHISVIFSLRKLYMGVAGVRMWGVT